MEHICTISISSQRLRALMAVAPKDEIRYYLCGIYLDPENVGVATNGHQLITVPVNVIKGKIPKNGIIMGVPKTKPTKYDDVKIDVFRCEEKGTLIEWLYLGKTNIRKEITSAIDGDFPKWRNVVQNANSKNKEAVSKICFNPEYIARPVKEFGAMFVSVKFNGQSGVIEVTFEENSESKLYVMPARFPAF